MNRSFFLTRLFQRKAYWLVPGALLLLLGGLIGNAQARPEAQEIYPTIAVDTTAETVEGNDWPLGTTVQISIDDPGTSLNPDFQGSAIAEEDPYVPTRLGLYFGGQYDLKPGDVVTASDGITTKVTSATSLRILGVNYEEDTVWGTGEPGVSFHVGFDGLANKYIDANEDGSWLVDFSDIFDAQYENNAWASQGDGDGDSTTSDYHFPNLHVTWNKDQLGGYGWLPGSTVQVAIYSVPGDAQPLISFSAVAGYATDKWSFGGDFGIDLKEQFNLQPGQWIEATDGRSTKSMTISRVQETIINDVLDTVSGVAEPEFAVYIRCGSEFIEGEAFRIIEPASDGTWTADFANPAPEDSRVWDMDYYNGILCFTSQSDSDGDSTEYFGISYYILNVNVGSQEIGLGWRWEPYEIPVIVTIDDPDNGAGIDFSTTAFYSNITSEQLQGYVIQPGDLITATDGVATKQTIVTGLAITSVDVINDQVSGTAAPGSLVEVGTDVGAAHLQTTTDQYGIWVADFSGIYDIVYGTLGNADQRDDDWDTTTAQWQALPCPPGDSISGHVWLEDGVTPAPNGLVTIEAYDQPYVTLYTINTNEDGSYACGLPDGTYRLYAEADAYSREYYSETIFENATPVQVVTGSPIPGIDFTLDTPGYVFDHMTFNFNEPIIAQLPVRQAIFFGTDRQRILDATYPASPIQDSVIITPHWAHTSAALLQYNYDPEMARRVLEQADWVDTDGDGIREKDGVRLHLKYLTTDLAMRQVIAAIFQENMLAIGIEIEVIIHLPMSEWLTLYPDLSIAQFAWRWVDINNDDPHSMIFYLTEWSNHNYGSYSNVAADQLLHLASLFGTRAEMLPYLEHYQRVVMADPPMMLLLLRIDPLPDQDGDGVPDADDLCPDVSSQGYDADLDGCLDTTQGLTGLVNQLYTDGEILNRSTRNTLLNQVVKVEGLLADGNYARAVNELDKFITLVNTALTSSTLTQNAADQLIAYTESLKRWISDTYLSGQAAPPAIGWRPVLVYFRW